MEFVDRKGIGHPDSICDAIMENVSIADRHWLPIFFRSSGLVLVSLRLTD